MGQGCRTRGDIVTRAVVRQLLAIAVLEVALIWAGCWAAGWVS